MLQFLLIFSVACVHLYDSVGRSVLATSRPAPTIILLVLSLFLSQAIAYWAIQLGCGLLMDRGNRKAFRLAAFVGPVFRLGGLASLGWAVFGWGWLDATRAFVGNYILIDEIIACLPFWVLVSWMWWAHEPIERRIREALLHRDIEAGNPVHPIESRFAFVWSNVRQQALVWLIPILTLAGWSECVDRLAEAAGRPPDDGGAEIVRLVGSLAIFIVAPMAVRRAWKTVELGPGELRDRIVAVCDAHGVRARGPFVWTAPGDAINAAVVGFLHPFRYLLISRSMLETFSEQPLLAVVAHEVAHLKLRHMLWLGLTVLGSVGVCGWAVAAIDFAVPSVRPYLNEASVSLVTLGFVFVAFGFVSRRFEWQADAFAVRHVAVHANESAAVGVLGWGAVTAALSQVAASNMMSMKQWSWRHGSLADRCRRAKLLHGRPTERPFPIDRQVSVIKVLTVLAILGSYAPMIWHQFLA